MSNFDLEIDCIGSEEFFPESQDKKELLLLQGLADYCVRCERITPIGELENGLCLVCRPKLKRRKV